MTTPAGWYPDPMSRHEYRYWDGAQWTAHASSGGQTVTDPLDGGAAGGGSPAETTPTAEAATPPEEAATPSEEAATPSEEAPAAAPPPSTPAPAPPAAAGGTPTGSPPPPAAPQQPPSPQAAPPPAAAPAPTTQTSTSGKAIGSLVLSILWIGGLGSIAAIVLGVMGRKDIKKSQGTQSGEGLAIAGIAIGILGILGALAFWSLFASVWIWGEGVRDEIDRQIEEFETEMEDAAPAPTDLSRMTVDELLAA